MRTVKAENTRKRRIVKFTILFLYILKSLVIILTWIFLMDHPMWVLILDATIPPFCIFLIIIISGITIRKAELEKEKTESKNLDLMFAKSEIV